MDLFDAQIQKWTTEYEERDSLMDGPDCPGFLGRLLDKHFPNAVRIGMLVVSLRNLVIPSFYCFPPGHTEETESLRRVTYFNYALFQPHFLFTDNMGGAGNPVNPTL